jgi:hypothetical protein
MIDSIKHGIPKQLIIGNRKCCELQAPPPTQYISSFSAQRTMRCSSS